MTAPWDRCLELAWESFAEGSIPVGSVLTNEDGIVVAEGRNRAFGELLTGGLAGSFIAHAEINVLAQLPPGEYGGHTLWSTLEPCFLCSAAAAHSHVGSLRFAAADPLMSGVERLPELNSWMESRWPSRTGPEEDQQLAAVAALLHLTWNIARRSDGVVARAYAEADPALLEVARDLDRSKSLQNAFSLEEAFETIVDAIE